MMRNSQQLRSRRGTTRASWLFTVVMPGAGLEAYCLGSVVTNLAGLGHVQTHGEEPKSLEISDRRQLKI